MVVKYAAIGVVNYITAFICNEHSNTTLSRSLSTSNFLYCAFAYMRFIEIVADTVKHAFQPLCKMRLWRVTQINRFTNLAVCTSAYVRIGSSD